MLVSAAIMPSPDFTLNATIHVSNGFCARSWLETAKHLFQLSRRD